MCVCVEEDYSGEEDEPLLGRQTVQAEGFGAGGPKDGCTSYKKEGAKYV